jgi:hypothetical protein
LVLAQLARETYPLKNAVDFSSGQLRFVPGSDRRFREDLYTKNLTILMAFPGIVSVGRMVISV